MTLPYFCRREPKTFEPGFVYKVLACVVGTLVRVYYFSRLEWEVSP